MIYIYMSFVVIWLAILIYFANSLIKRGTWFLIIGSLFLLGYSLLPAIGLVLDGQLFKSTPMSYIGQALTVFASVICGALISIGYSELRTKHIIKNDNNV